MPKAARQERSFDVRDLYEGPSPTSGIATAAAAAAPLDEKLRQAYFWIVNNAIITPYYDIEFNDSPGPSFKFGGAGTEVRLPTGQSYSSLRLSKTCLSNCRSVQAGIRPPA